MSKAAQYPNRVGELRPNQLMFNYGVGALVDLPKFAVLVQVLPGLYTAIWSGREAMRIAFDPVSQSLQSVGTQIKVDPAQHDDIGIRRLDHLDHGGDLFVFAFQDVAQQKPRTVAIKFRVKKGKTERIRLSRTKRHANQTGSKP